MTISMRMAGTATAAALATLVATSAMASTTTETTGWLNQTDDGQDFTLDFGPSLGLSDGGGTLTIYGEDLDLGTANKEWLEVSVEGDDMGTYVCDFDEKYGTNIPGWTGSKNACDFELVITFTETELNDYLADGSFNFELDLGRESDEDDSSRLKATLSYTDASTTPAVPLPAGGLLLMTGLGALAATRRKKKAA